MIYWILKTLWYQRISLAASVIGVTAALTLVVVLDAAFVGESKQIVSYIRHANADVWVMQKGVGNMHMASTFVSDWKVKQVAQTPGVKKATPILYANTIVQAGGRNWFAYVLGLDADARRAGPWSMTEGKSMPNPGEIILPHVIGRMANLHIGDQAKVADKKFQIVGFSQGTFSMANSVVFVHRKDLQQLLALYDTISLILVDAQPGVHAVDLAKRIESRVHKVSALPQQQFIQNDYQLALLMGVEVIFFMSVVGTALATLIVAFTVFNLIHRRHKELAICKALGFKNKAVYAAVLVQSLVVTGLAIVLTLMVCQFLLPALSSLNPMITLAVTPWALLRLGLIALFIAMAAACLPAAAVAKVDPVSVFKVSS